MGIIDTILNIIFYPILLIGNKTIEMIIISFIVSLIIVLSYKFLTDQQLMKSLKDELKLLQKQMKEHKEDKNKLMKLQKKAMETNMRYMKMSFKPTLITMLPLLAIFVWLKNNYVDCCSLFSFNLSWIWTYIIFSIVFSTALRKIFKLH